jgi:hypothetical protein
LTVDGSSALSEQAVREVLGRRGFGVASWDLRYSGRGPSRTRRLSCEVKWRAPDSPEPPSFLPELCALEGVDGVSWKVIPK